MCLKCQENICALTPAHARVHLQAITPTHAHAYIHTPYIHASTHALIIHKHRARAQVVGDRAVGSIGPGVDPRVSCAVVGTQELLRMPTQRLMRYQLFIGRLFGFHACELFGFHECELFGSHECELFGFHA